MTNLRDVNLNDLNNDVLYNVIDFLSVFDKINLRKVCRRLRSIVDIHSARKLKTFYINAPLDKHFDDIIQNFGMHLNDLRLVLINNRLNKLNEQMQWINEYCEKLSSLKLEARAFRGSMCLDRTLVALQFFSHLTHLKLTNIQIKDESEFQHFSNFEVLKLENVANFTGCSLLHMKRLRVLDLRLCNDLNLDNLVKLFQNDRSLKELSLIKCHEVDGLSFEEIVKEIPQIERLSIHFFWPSAHNPNILKRLENLVSLKIHNLKVSCDMNSYIEDIAANKQLESWEINGENMIFTNLNPTALELLGNCTSLNYLSFVNGHFITDSLLIALGKNLRLKKFSLDNCSGFSANGLLAFSTYSKDLVYLGITNCLVPQSITQDIEHAVAALLPPQKITIFYDINCGFRPYEGSDWMDSNVSTRDSWCH